MDKVFRIAIYGVLFEEGRILMTRSDTPRGPIWNFPGGALEWGEDPASAVEREFMEETGLTVRIDDLLYTSRLFHANPHFPHQQSYHTYYQVERTQGEVLAAGNGDDVLGVAWYALGAMPVGEMIKSDLEFLHHLKTSGKYGPA
jgi:ADP-ribose pyrophosphatase YjhB (NUDIX family)